MRDVRSSLMRYCGVSGTSTVINILLTIGLTLMVPLPTATWLAFGLAGFYSLVGHYFWTFHGRTKWPFVVCLGLFAIGVAALGFFLNRGVAKASLAFFRSHHHWPFSLTDGDFMSNVAAYLVAAAMTLPFSFAWNHYVVFKNLSNPRT